LRNIIKQKLPTTTTTTTTKTKTTTTKIYKTKKGVCTNMKEMGGDQ